MSGETYGELTHAWSLFGEAFMRPVLAIQGDEVKEIGFMGNAPPTRVAVRSHSAQMVGGSLFGVASFVWSLTIWMNPRLAWPAFQPWMLFAIGVALYGHAAFEAWQEERIRSEGAMSDLAALKASHALDVEWDRAIATFQGLISEPITANFTEFSDGRKTWALYAPGEPKRRACETACRLSGHALGLSKSIMDLPPEITNEPDDLVRWLTFVVERDGWDGPSGNGTDNTGPKPLHSTSKSIRNVALASKRRCEDCRNRESFL